MNEEKSADETLRRLARAVEANLATHPEPEVFLAHQRGELPGPEAQALEEHLAWCRECAGIWRDLPRFLDGDIESLDPAEKAADWRALQERLEAELPPAEEVHEAAPDPALRARLASGLAAALAVALGGAAFWIVHLSGKLEDTRRPRPNVPILDLAPPAAMRAGEAPAPAIALDRNVVLIFNTVAELEDRSYEARILGEDGEVVWTIEGLVPTLFGNLNLELPAEALDPGLYRIVVRGGEGEPVVGEYNLRVVEPPAGPAE